MHQVRKSQSLMRKRRKQMKTKLLASIAAALAVVCIAEATQYSKLQIITKAKERGVWAATKAIIVQADLEEEWAACQYITDDYPQFIQATNMLVAAGVATADDIIYILTNSIDTAVPDGAFRRIYDSENSTGYGRIKWHGKKIREEYDLTNAVRITTYEDGTVFRDHSEYITPQDSAKAYLDKIAATTNSGPARVKAARKRLLKTKTDEANGVVSNVTVRIQAGK